LIPCGAQGGESPSLVVHNRDSSGDGYSLGLRPWGVRRPSSFFQDDAFNTLTTLLQDTISTATGGMFGSALSALKSSLQTEVRETDASLELQMDVPGVAAEDISVQVEDDNILHIEGYRRSSYQSEDGQEEAVKAFKFERDFTIDTDRFDIIDGITVKLANGVLKINILKKQQPEKEEKKVRSIPVIKEVNNEKGEDGDKQAAKRKKSELQQKNNLTKKQDDLTITTDEHE